MNYSKLLDLKPVFAEDQVHSMKRAQEYLKPRWGGLDANRVGIPGNSNIVNQKHQKGGKNENE